MKENETNERKINEEVDKQINSYITKDTTSRKQSSSGKRIK